MLLVLFVVEPSISRRLANALKPSQPPKKFLHVQMYSSREKVSISIEGENVCNVCVSHFLFTILLGPSCHWWR